MTHPQHSVRLLSLLSRLVIIHTIQKYNNDAYSMDLCMCVCVCFMRIHTAREINLLIFPVLIEFPEKQNVNKAARVLGFWRR